MGLLPPAGWRVIDTRSPSEQGLAGVALAAPHSERPGGWALIYLSGRDDWWQFSADPGRSIPGPGGPLAAITCTLTGLSRRS